MPETLQLQAQGIGRRDPRSGTWLLRGVDLTIPLGDRMAVVGSSGAGKTVLLRALAMLDPLEEGAIVWQGKPVQGDRVPAFRKQVVYLHQRPALFDGSVEANLRQPYALKVHRDARAHYDGERVAGLLTALGRDRSFLEKGHHDLSGGEGQVVALIRALQLDPAILLLDEATASLDRTTSRMAEALLERWHAEGAGGRALVWVTHDPDQASRVAERTVVIQAGQVVPEPPR
ncbi:putative ABC transport system ATP-binding protein [Singulisphaera sp. GP187]|uniref:ABC transporter ATP-binding protein n=1 Tax=Singulisphaera sp. GP187 TaxID=1882752 RepID=UPI00092A4D98|nr:ATP-binding cassette domain-containing protein [Singulisphaera sp. GP187]SIO45112.1 putative ABC transport system ATP-binding protein [Singulisphaera sp. GP187]